MENFTNRFGILKSFGWSGWLIVGEGLAEVRSNRHCDIIATSASLMPNNQ